VDASPEMIPVPRIRRFYGMLGATHINRFLSAAATLALIIVIAIDFRMFNGDDPFNGDAAHDLLWWIVWGITIIVVVGLQCNAHFYVVKKGNHYFPNFGSLAQLPIWCRCLAAVGLIATISLTAYAVHTGFSPEVHNGLVMEASGRIRLATVSEIFRDHLSGAALWSGAFIQLLAYPALYFVSGTHLRTKSTD